MGTCHGGGPGDRLASPDSRRRRTITILIRYGTPRRTMTAPEEKDDPESSPGVRRRLLEGIGAALGAASAGCLDGTPDADTPTDGDPGRTPTDSGAEAPFFEVSDLSPVSLAGEPGDRFAVEATVTNTGESAGTGEISLRIDGETRENRTVGLDPGGKTGVAFEDATIPDLDPGAYAYGVYSGDDRTISTLTVEGGRDDTEQVAWHRDHDWETDEAAATNWDNYEITELLSVEHLMAIDVAPDGRVFYVTRGAPFVTYGHGTMEVGWVDPDTGESDVVLERRVQVGSLSEGEGSARELGGQGIALDPDFAENGHVYLYYTPAADEREPIENPYEQFHADDIDVTTGYMVVSRFKLYEGRLLEATEQELIRIIDQHDTCCHRGGNLQFGPEGHLYVTTGDNNGGPGNGTDPSKTLGRDDRYESSPTQDASRTSGNTADLRGSVLRITPEPDGSYSIPEGNFKQYWEDETGESFSSEEFRPEIYAMGFRNPFIVSLDEHTGTLFVGDYGPGTSWHPDIGPVGLGTWHVICEPVFAGWPFFKGYYPYRKYDYQNDELGQPFWPDNPRNTSRNNTGLEKLPPVTPATVWQGQDYAQYEANPEGYVEGPAWLGSANAGPAYRYSEAYGEGALDPYFEGKQFLMASWAPGKGWIGYLTFNEDGSIDIDDFMPDHPWRFPTEMKFGPDGRLFVMDYSHEGLGGIHMVEYLG
ncbi:hypothetical protein BRD03_09345 [Halobacteriales archaeon QS_9_68_17]|nr:MAG: hypothetical protein BRD03_09345 [Halobacteriales archaeon QS_9_68_17]